MVGMTCAESFRSESLYICPVDLPPILLHVHNSVFFGGCFSYLVILIFAYLPGAVEAWPLTLSCLQEMSCYQVLGETDAN